MCKARIKVFIPKGYDYKEISVRCGSTSPTGEPYLCEKCERKYSGRNWRKEAIESGENW